MHTPDEDTLRKLFQGRGLPFTPQRRAVLSVLAGRLDHPTADTVFEETRHQLPGTSRTTVYRTLDVLEQLGLVQRIAHPGATARFDPRTDRHDHLICDACGAVLDLDDALGDLELPDLGPSGFRGRELSVTVRGLCRDCAAG